MADKAGIGVISELFVEAAYKQGIPKNSYNLWLRIFRYVSNEELEEAALYLIEWRQKTSMVAIGEVNWALCEIGVYSGHYSRQDPAFAKAMEKQFPKVEGTGITLAEFCKTYPEAGQALTSYMRREE